MTEDSEDILDRRLLYRDLRRVFFPSSCPLCCCRSTFFSSPPCAVSGSSSSVRCRCFGVDDDLPCFGEFHTVLFLLNSFFNLDFSLEALEWYRRGSFLPRGMLPISMAAILPQQSNDLDIVWTTHTLTTLSFPIISAGPKEMHGSLHVCSSTRVLDSSRARHREGKNLLLSSGAAPPPGTLDIRSSARKTWAFPGAQSPPVQT
mmetsp:Transcript_1997/g.4534  ORF Transcript_1997/g.4534 Transcript_1997/m.4534 type:complete len:203 (-) Transcript_1997:5-613(-)